MCDAKQMPKLIGKKSKEYQAKNGRDLEDGWHIRRISDLLE